jgi:hypothetical protein
MKKRLLFFSLLGCGLAFGQNQSFLPVTPTLIPGPEIFRFSPGYITQDQSLTGFGFGPADRWLSFGEVSTPSQMLYGNRFQFNERALITGYSSLSPNNPRIEWLHNGGSTEGNLQFRVTNSFTSTISNIVAEMTAQGNTYFGKYVPGLYSSLNPKVGIGFNDNDSGLDIYNPIQVPPTFNPVAVNVRLDYSGTFGYGVYSDVFGGFNSFGVYGNAEGFESSIGVYGKASAISPFGAGVFGDLPISGSPSQFAGYFNGDVYLNTLILPSDVKFKENVKEEVNILEKIALLNPVTYNYKDVEGMNLSKGEQHGFISQELYEVFPELTRDITRPIFDEHGKITSEISFKAINYVGLISLLTESIQELNTELIQVRQDFDEYKANDVIRGQIIQNTPAVNGYSIEQNVPNPFSDRTSIRFQLALGVESATLSIFNLNGAFVRDYQLNSNSGEIEILASEIGKGMYIYSLNQNGQEIVSKRMIIK